MGELVKQLDELTDEIKLEECNAQQLQTIYYCADYLMDAMEEISREINRILTTGDLKDSGIYELTYYDDTGWEGDWEYSVDDGKLAIDKFIDHKASYEQLCEQLGEHGFVPIESENHWYYKEDTWFFKLEEIL